MGEVNTVKRESKRESFSTFSLNMVVTLISLFQRPRFKDSKDILSILSYYHQLKTNYRSLAHD